MTGGKSGAGIERYFGTRPHTSQLAKERLHGHLTPAGQSPKCQLELV